MHQWILSAVLTVVILLGATASQAPFAQEKKTPELKDVINVLPKFAIPMREVGDRFQNMYFAAKGGNWGLAFYMSKYMNGAMNPAKITKPDEYPMWSGFYESSIEPVNKAIMAKDFPAFEKAYNEAIKGCNTCHAGMGYAFIQVHRLKTPPDQGVNYTLKSKGEDVPK
ncbi:MAG TPA: hypothetical protein VFL90_21030 [Methylomirabilota bacterium]|nr:hypothetical protein [Methylomirabilota bacterium]